MCSLKFLQSKATTCSSKYILFLSHFHTHVTRHDVSRASDLMQVMLYPVLHHKEVIFIESLLCTQHVSKYFKWNYLIQLYDICIPYMEITIIIFNLQMRKLRYMESNNSKGHRGSKSCSGYWNPDGWTPEFLTTTLNAPQDTLVPPAYYRHHHSSICILLCS